MKNFFAVAAVLIGIFAVQVQASAQEVYAASETRRGQITDTYVLTDSVEFYNQRSFYVSLHSVGRNYSYSKYWDLGFLMDDNDDLYAVLLPSSETVRVTNGNTVLKDFYFQIFMTLAKANG